MQRGRRAAARSLLLVTLSGCGMNASRFTRQYSEVFCDKVFECWPEEVIDGTDYSDEDECQVAIATSKEAVETSCDHDRDAAEACVAQLETLACEDFTMGRLPEVCERVCE